MASIRSSARLIELLRRPVLAMAALLLLANPAEANADTRVLERTFLERAAILAADRSCSLFHDGERIALMSGLQQARGALLREGYDPEEIDRLSREVGAHARTLGCHHAEIVDVSALIRSAYLQFAKTSYLAYPGSFAAWEASRSRHDQWALKQTERSTGALFGLRRTAKAGAPPRLAFALPGERPAPASVQLLMRDPARLSAPWFGVLGDADGRLTPPPRSMIRPEWAAQYQTETDVLGDRIHVFYFSDTALTRLEELDPREAIAVEIVPAALDRNTAARSIAFEVGDFLAARYFTRIPEPPPPAPPGESAKTAALPPPRELSARR